MTPLVETLQALALCEEAIRGLEARRAELPRELDGVRQAIEEREAALAAAREELAGAERAQREREAALQDAEALRERQRARAPMVKTNEEYRALLAEIEHLGRRIAELEDAILEGWETIETLRASLAEREATIRKELGELAAQAQRLERTIAEVEAELERRRAERSTLVERLEGGLRERYARVARAAGFGVAFVEAGHCAGCHRAVPPETANRVLAGEVHACGFCARILVARPG